MAVATAIAVMMLFPPFYHPPYRALGENIGLIRYDFLLGNNGGQVEVALLFAQFLAVVVIGAIAYILFADKT